MKPIPATKNFSKRRFARVIQIKFIVILLCFVSKKSSSQTTYSYDLNGNRTNGLISVGPPSSQRAYTPPPVPSKEFPTRDLQTKQLVKTFGISVYPTMVNELINITVSAATEYAPALITIYDNLGRLVTTKKITNSSQEQINFNGVLDGIYNISVKIKDQEIFYKVIKGK